jgi:hypothetical protein
MSFRHDLLSVPDSREIPIIIEARRYLGHRHWEEKQIEKSKVLALNSAALEAFRTRHCTQHNQKKKSLSQLDESTYQLYDDDEVAIHPWSGMLVEMFSYFSNSEGNYMIRAQVDCVPQDKELILWEGMLQASSSDIAKYIIPILSNCSDYSVEGIKKLGVRNLDLDCLLDIQKKIQQKAYSKSLLTMLLGRSIKMECQLTRKNI